MNLEDVGQSGKPGGPETPDSSSTRAVESRVGAGGGLRKGGASVRLWLTYLVLACVLPVWVAAGFLVYYNYQTKRALTEQRMLDTARAVMLAVDSELDKIHNDLTVLATSRALAAGELEIFHHRAQLLVATRSGGDIVLSDASGQQLINSHEPYGTRLPKRNVPEAVRQIYKTGRPYVSDLYTGAITKRHLVSVDVPVFRNEQIVYDLAMAIPSEYFAKLLLQQHLPQEWIGRIVDNNGVYVARTRSPEQFVGRHTTEELWRALTAAKEGTVEAKNHESISLFNSFSRSSASGWTVVVGVPKAVMLAEIRRWLAWAVAGTAMLSLAGIWLALWIGRRIAGSIQALIPPALALGRGESVTIGHLNLAETSEVGESLVKASELIDQRAVLIEQRAAASEREEAARHEAEALKQLNTELERSEAEAHARAEELAVIMDAVPGATLIAKDPSCAHIIGNQAGSDLFRLPHGGNFSLTGPESERPRYELLKEGARVPEDKLPMHLAARGVQVRDWEGTLVFPDGTAREIFGNAFPLLDSTGKVRGAVGSFIDITQRTRSEQALRESEERFRQVVEGSPVGICVETDGRFRYVNPAAMKILGARSPIEVIGQPVLDRIHPDERASITEHMRTIRQTGKPLISAEQRHLRLGGTAFDAEVTAVPFSMEGRNGAIVFFRDVTDRKRAAQELAQAEQRLRQAAKLESIGRLAGGVAHDFNNLLMVMRSYTEMLRDSLPEAGKSHRYADEVLKAADRAASLTRQMLAFSRNQVLSPVVLDLNSVIGDTTRMLKRLIGEHIELHLELAEELWPVEADPDQIAQVLMNLAVNSRDAIAEHGSVTIATRKVTVSAEEADTQPCAAGEYVSFSVRDTGSGMSKEVQEKIFEPFFTTKAMGHGTGLGLSTVYGIVKQSGGSIAVESAPGQGTCFTIYLPRAKAAMKLAAHAPGETRQRGDGTVLVVEDEAALRGVICEVLADLGYTVLEAASGEEALACAAEYTGQIDLLLTDVIMPKMNGRELSQSLTATRPGLKTLFISGYSDSETLGSGMHAPGESLLQKPFSLATLARRTEETIGATDPKHPKLFGTR